MIVGYLRAGLAALGALPTMNAIILQFAHPDAVAMLREIRKRPRTGETVTLSAADPLYLAGLVVPGPRVPALLANTISYTDGALTEQVLTA